MVMKLHGGWTSPFSNIAAFTLHEKNADFEFVVENLISIKKEEYLATKNPFGKVPVLQDDELVLFESRAIARYVIAKFEGQGTPLMGSTLKEQALVNVWNEVESQTFHSAAWAICGEHKYLAGDFFSLADLCHIPVLHCFMWLADPVQRSVITGRPRVQAWYDDAVARPAWQKIVTKPEASDWSFIQKV